MVTNKGRSKAKGASKYASSRSPEELREILEDISYDNAAKVKGAGRAGADSGRDSSRSGEGKAADDAWSPTPYAAFKLLVSARFAAALWTTISDCDETYNYWEPTHYLLYGKGFQTWEYSPEYALRSYTYLMIHALPAKIYDYFLSPNPLLVFFFIRCFLAFISASTEVFLYRSIRKYVGGNVSRIGLVTSLFAPGMFISTSAFLPSAFSSYMTALALGAWLEGLHELSIFAIAVSAILSWPFAAITGALIAFDILILQRKFILFISWTLISLLVVLLPVILIDSNQYGKWVVAPLNIVTYNIFSSKGGPDLYGTEPWTFYIRNLLLNFNIMFVIAAFSPFLLLLSGRWNTAIKEKFVIIGTMFLWFGIFLAQPHKEERFMFPIFPLIPVCGAIGVDCLQKLAEKLYRAFVEFIFKKSPKAALRLLRWDYQTFFSAVVFIIIVLAGLMGCSRIVALHYGYRAPFDVFFNLHREGTFQKLEAEDSGREFTVCYGKEWHRFPTSFFLPNTNWNVRFIKSEFRGQLPSLYPVFDREGTKRIPENMNDLNTEEVSRYVELINCDFLVDSIDDSKETTTPNEPNYAANISEWKVLSDQEFLNAQKSHPVFRAFYIPFISSDYTVFDRYVLLKNRRRRKRKTSKPHSGRTGKEFNDDLDDF